METSDKNIKRLDEIAAFLGEFMDADNYNKNLALLFCSMAKIASLKNVVDEIKKNKFKSIKEIDSYLKHTVSSVDGMFKIYDDLMAISKNNKKQ